MANTAVNALSIQKKYEKRYFKEMVRSNQFNAYMGAGAMNPIVVKRQLVESGQLINIPLISALNGNGVGTGTLTGNEEALGNFSYDVKPYWHRHAVVVPKDQQKWSSFDLKGGAREMLMLWDTDEIRDAIIDGMTAVTISGAYDAENGHSQQVYLKDSSTAQKNTWSAANEFRLLFGDSFSNYNATFATALATVGSGDELGVNEVALMKRQARKRNKATGLPQVRPIRVSGVSREYYVMFTGSNNFAKLKADMNTINLDGRPRDVASNPIFQDGDLEYDGVIIREIPEQLTGVAAGLSANQEGAYLMGAQAMALAWSQTPIATQSSENDYGFRPGKGTESSFSAEKLVYNGLDHGMVTGFFYTA
ncbi:MAG: DUF4043 family protein [Colwellia sp.]|nr:DUF4043 family protein [Colwellia sp.]